MKKIGFLGAGAMGSRLIVNLHKAGYTLTVYNRQSEKLSDFEALGIQTATTPAEAAKGQDVVFSMVRDNEASRFVWLSEQGALTHMADHAIALECATLTPAWAKELSQAFAACKRAFLEAPVLGTRPQAEQAQLIYLIGGEAAVLQQVYDILSQLSQKVYHVGAVGQASLLKLAINTQYAAQVAIWAETLALLKKANLDMTEIVPLINGLPTTSPAMQVAGNLMLAENYTPMFPIELVVKDLNYALETAQVTGLHLSVLQSLTDVYESANQKGDGAQNIVAIATRYQ